MIPRNIAAGFAAALGVQLAVLQLLIVRVVKSNQKHGADELVLALHCGAQYPYRGGIVVERTSPEPGEVS
jgi:hypothetical protein